MNMEEFTTIAKQAVSDRNTIMSESNQITRQGDDFLKQRYELTKGLAEIDNLNNVMRGVEDVREMHQVSEIKNKQKLKKTNKKIGQSEDTITTLRSKLENDLSMKDKMAFYKFNYNYFLLTRITGVHLVPTKSANVVKGGVVNVKNSSLKWFNFNLHNNSSQTVRETLFDLMAAQSSENSVTWDELFKLPEATQELNPKSEEN